MAEQDTKGSQLSPDDAAALKMLLEAFSKGGGGSGLGGLKAQESPSLFGDSFANQGGQFRTILPQLGAQRAPNYAPSGPNLYFTGGSPYPVDDRSIQIATSLALASRVIRALKAQKPPKEPTANG